MNRSARRAHRRPGTALVELLLVLPLIAALMLMSAIGLETVPSALVVVPFAAYTSVRMLSGPDRAGERPRR